MPEWVRNLLYVCEIALTVVALWLLIRWKTPGVVPKKGALAKWILLGVLALIAIIGLMMLAMFLYVKSL